jgi:hypothetical protein
MEINGDMRMCSSDTENMCTNIPKSDVINIINNILKTNPEIVETKQKEIMHMLKNSDRTEQFPV